MDLSEHESWFWRLFASREARHAALVSRLPNSLPFTFSSSPSHQRPVSTANMHFVVVAAVKTRLGSVWSRTKCTVLKTSILVLDRQRKNFHSCGLIGNGKFWNRHPGYDSRLRFIREFKNFGMRFVQGLNTMRTRTTGDPVSTATTQQHHASCCPIPNISPISARLHEYGSLNKHCQRNREHQTSSTSHEVMAKNGYCRASARAFRWQPRSRRFVIPL